MTANIGLIAFDSSGRQLVIGSTFKGVIAGVCIGWFAKKVHSLPLGILFGLGVGMFLAYLIAAIPQPSGKHYYFAIMLPGSLVGAIVGYATQKHQSSREPTAVRT